ncbi:DUF6263 family protein [Flavisolibacter nicotianae]|uniref:DUF6263 family protein n=1 Tax=Flavisolibacter nicotianae TaxID=2364882 RepID=UPI0013C44458|nr:DUF6263 family protein [Flavisolibacter nicotianae]
MNKVLLFTAYLLFFVSCQPASTPQTEMFDKGYKLVPQLLGGMAYKYDIDSETLVETVIDGKEIQNLSQSSFGILYQIARDSLGNLSVRMSFDKIHSHIKNGAVDSELDAQNASFSLNPVEKILGALKLKSITGKLSPKGEILEVNGYQSVGEELLKNIDPNDGPTREMAKQQWEQISQEVVRKNIKQFFCTFPDSLVYVGDSWRQETTEDSLLGLRFTNTCTLQDMYGEMALIAVKGSLESKGGMTNLLGYDVISDLHREQNGTYSINAKTGLVVRSQLTSIMKGTMKIQGREVPLMIKRKFELKRRG